MSRLRIYVSHGGEPRLRISGSHGGEIPTYGCQANQYRACRRDIYGEIAEDDEDGEVGYTNLSKMAVDNLSLMQTLHRIFGKGLRYYIS